MKILFASEFFHPHWTGLSKSILKTALRLQEKGHQCAVLTTQHEKSLPLFEKYHGIDIFRSRPLFSISRTKYSANVILKFLSIAKKYDIIFINCPNSNVLPVTLISRLFRKKVVVFSNGDLILPKSLSNKIVEKIYDFSMIASCALASTVSNYTYDYAEHSRILSKFMHKFKPLLLPSKAYEKNIDESKNTMMKNIRKEKNATYLIGFAGRFVEEKGFDILLKAIDKIARSRKDIHFVYAGSEKIGYEKFFEMHKQLWNPVAAHITRLGLLTSEAQMNAFYKNLDLFVLPSRSDTFAIVQSEAMEHKVPVVVTNIPGARWLVKESGFGKIARPEDANSLADAILDTLMHKKQILQKYQNAMLVLDESRFFGQFDNL